MWNRSIILIALALASTPTTARAAEPKVAVFDFEFVDTSLEGATNGPRSDEEARLAWLDDEMRRRLTQSGRVDVVDVVSIAGRVRTRNLRTCGGCDADFASELGARYSITGWVQKVSNLILNMNIVVRDVGTGGVVLSKSVDMRGNTDESWSRALDWLVARYLLPPNEGVFR
jgi:Protein of unknown function (DUF2380)